MSERCEDCGEPVSAPSHCKRLHGSATPAERDGESPWVGLNTIDYGDAPNGSDGGYDKSGNRIVPMAMQEIMWLREALRAASHPVGPRSKSEAKRLSALAHPVGSGGAEEECSFCIAGCCGDHGAAADMGEPYAYAVERGLVPFISVNVHAAQAVADRDGLKIIKLYRSPIPTTSDTEE